MVAGHDGDDGYCGGCGLCRASRRRAGSDDQIYLEADKLGGEGGKSLLVSLRGTELEDQILALDIAQLPQTVPETSPDRSDLWRRRR